MSTPSSTSDVSGSSASQGASVGSYFPVPFHLQNADPTSQQQHYMVSQSMHQPYIAPIINVPAVPQAFPPPVYPGTTPAVAGAYAIPQYQQAQQLFQRDAQMITPEAIESVKAALANSEIEHKADTKKKAIPRKAAGQSWEDPTLTEWPENNFRLFCGDLGNEVNDDVLSKAFSRFPSFNMARVVRDKRTGKTRGYGFVSFSNPSDLAAALKEMNGTCNFLNVETPFIITCRSGLAIELFVVAENFIYYLMHCF